MKKSLNMLPCIFAISLLASAAGGMPIRSHAALRGAQSGLEGQARGKEQKFKAFEKIATGSDAGLEEEENSDGGFMEEDVELESGESPEDEELESEADVSFVSNLLTVENAEKDYALCGYWFIEMDWPLICVIGEDFNQEEVSGTVLVYLDGPDGHMDDPVELAVKWDYSEVDFTNEGSYPVTGTLDTGSLEYPVDWDAVSPPAFTMEVIKGGTMSFSPEADGDTLTLNYEMNGNPFSYKRISPELYESLDGGRNWNNISESRRVVLSEERIRISGVTANALYQAVNLDLGYGYDSCSDIVEVEAGEEIRSVCIIASGGVAGGEDWNEENGSIWNPDCERDGPYRILEYQRTTSWPSPLDTRIFLGEEEFFMREYYDEIWVSYGDYPGGFWHDKIKLPAQWDWGVVDAMDWSRAGTTVVHGSFSEDTVRENSDVLDFDTMPELSFTISVIAPGGTFNLGAQEERILENNSVSLQFYDDSGEAFAFDDIAGMKVWCSVDGGDNWYNITDLPNVELAHDSLKVSYLKDDSLRAKGYTFQMEQANPTDHERYSCAMNICHGINGIYFNADIGGERGGGKRQEKPPQGLFGGEDFGGDPEEELPEPPETTPDSEPPKPPETEASRPSEPETPPVPEHTQPSGSGGKDESDGSGNGESGSSGNDESGSGGTGESGSGGTGNGGGGHGKPSGKSVPAAESRAEIQTAVPESSMAAVPTDALAAEPIEESEPPAGQDAEENAGERSPSTEAWDEEAEKEEAGSKEAGPAEPESAKAAVVSSRPVPDTRPGLFRIAAGAAAVAIGGTAGFWMIRRR